MGIDVSIIVPAFNEEDSVARLYHLIVQHMVPTGRRFEVIFVDDGSTDSTFARLKALSERNPRVTVIKLRKNYGQTPAITAGIDSARGSLLVTMDADLQNDPADIPALLSKIDEGYDLAVGYRVRRQDKFLSRKLPSIVANWIIGRVTGLPIRDNGCSLKAFRAHVIKNMPLYSDMHRFMPAMSIPVGTNIAQVGVRHHARQFGTSKYGFSRVYKVLVDLLTIKSILLFACRPLTCFAGVSAVAAVVAAGSAFMAIGRAADAAPTVVFSTLSVLSGSLAVFLASAGLVVAIAHLQTSGIAPNPAGISPTWNEPGASRIGNASSK